MTLPPLPTTTTTTEGNEARGVTEQDHAQALHVLTSFLIPAHARLPTHVCQITWHGDAPTPLLRPDAPTVIKCLLPTATPQHCATPHSSSLIARQSSLISSSSFWSMSLKSSLTWAAKSS